MLSVVRLSNALEDFWRKYVAVMLHVMLSVVGMSKYALEESWRKHVAAMLISHSTQLGMS